MKKFVKKPHLPLAPQLTKCRLKVGDEVVVTTGASKGQKGTIEKLDLALARVTVKGVNTKVKHQKPNAQFPEGGIRQITVPIALSNVAYYDPKLKKATRVGYRTEDGQKQRFCKASGSLIEKKLPATSQA